eukprot:4117909-Amphidinium_carterae.1
MALLVFAGCILCPLGNLTVFHCYLIASNTTTNEEITSSYNGKNPFSLGLTRSSSSKQDGVHTRETLQKKGREKLNGVL